VSDDILLVSGVVLAILSIVPMLTAWVERRRPRLATIGVVVSGVLLLLGIFRASDGFQLSDIPHAFINVAALILN